MLIRSKYNGEIINMSQATISIRIDENLKKQFDDLCNELGLTMSTAFNIFVKAVVRGQGIPFDVSITPNAQTQKAIEDVEKGKGLSKIFTNTDELFEDLDA